MILNCVICADIFCQASEVSLTVCGHLFHTVCLLHWIERSKTCPHCRCKCVGHDIRKVYFNASNQETNYVDADSMQQQLEEYKQKMTSLTSELNTIREKIEEHEQTEKRSMKTIKLLEKKVDSKECLMLNLQEKIKNLQYRLASFEALEYENKTLKNKIQQMSTLETILNSSTGEIHTLLESISNPETLAVLLTCLKNQLRASDSKKAEIDSNLKKCQNILRKTEKEKEELKEQVNFLRSENHKYSQEILELKSKQEKEQALTYIENVVKEETIGNLSVSEKDSQKPQCDKVRQTTSPSTSENSFSPGILKSVKSIESSDSPYLRIQASNIGLSSLAYKTLAKGSLQNNISSITDGLNKNTILTKIRVEKGTKLPLFVSREGKCENMVYNGLGGSERKDEFLFPNQRPATTENKSLQNRVKTGKIRKISLRSPSMGKRYLISD